MSEVFPEEEENNQCINTEIETKEHKIFWYKVKTKLKSGKEIEYFKFFGLDFSPDHLLLYPTVNQLIKHISIFITNIKIKSIYYTEGGTKEIEIRQLKDVSCLMQCKHFGIITDGQKDKNCFPEILFSKKFFIDELINRWSEFSNLLIEKRKNDIDKYEAETGVKAANTETNRNSNNKNKKATDMDVFKKHFYNPYITLTCTDPELTKNGKEILDDLESQIIGSQ